MYNLKHILGELCNTQIVVKKERGRKFRVVVNITLILLPLFPNQLQQPASQNAPSLEVYVVG